MNKNLLGIIAGTSFLMSVGSVSYIATDIRKDNYRNYLEKKDKGALGLSAAGIIIFGYCLNKLNRMKKED